MATPDLCMIAWTIFTLFFPKTEAGCETMQVLLGVQAPSDSVHISWKLPKTRMKDTNKKFLNVHLSISPMGLGDKQRVSQPSIFSFMSDWFVI